MTKPEREESIIEMMVLTQRLNEWVLKMQLARIRRQSKQVKS